MKALENILSQLRTHIHGAYALVTYTAQLSRLQIECYIPHLLSRSSLFRDVDDIMPVTGKDDGEVTILLSRIYAN